MGFIFTGKSSRVHTIKLAHHAVPAYIPTIWTYLS